MNDHIEKVIHNEKILAIVIRAQAVNNLEQTGGSILFATPDEFPFQVGLHNWDTGKVIKEHFHLPFEKLENFPVQEFFHIISGKVRIDLYDDRENDLKVAEITVSTGDSVILNTGHGMESIEPAKLVELKQGPYRGKDLEKRYFS